VLKRADGRTPQEIFNDGGFFGRADAPITIEHARMHVAEICNTDWVQRWKAQTHGKTDIVPYVATGFEEQKGEKVYTIKIPLSFPPGNATINPIIGTDTGDLKTATIIALKTCGNEVVFLTGIPNRFIFITDPNGNETSLEDFFGKRNKTSP
jgi:hypothetical protein